MTSNIFRRDRQRGSRRFRQRRLAAAEHLEARHLLAGDVFIASYPATDGAGYSLVIADPHAGRESWNEQLSWRTSTSRNGSPGSGESGESRGDINGDGQRDVTDLDLLQVGIRQGDTDSVLDINSAGNVDHDDVTSWLSVVGMADRGRPFASGDADLDGDVDASDLNALGIHWRADEASWSGGDFTGDAAVNALDLNALALNWQHGLIAAASTARVPRAPLPASRASLPHSVVPDDVPFDSKDGTNRDNATTTTEGDDPNEDPVVDPPDFSTPADPNRGLPIDKNPAADDEWMFLELVDEVLGRWPDSP